MAQHYGPHIVTDSLVLCYDAGDEVSYTGGATWTDLSGNGNVGTLNGSVRHISSHRSYTSAQYSGVHGDGTFIYVSDILGLDEDSGLHVYSVDVSGNLTHIDNDYPDIGNAYGVHTDGNFIYVANDVNGLEVYSVNGSGILTHVDNDDQGNNYRDVWGDGTFIYVAAGTGGILSYSVNSSGILTYIDSVAAGWTVGVWGDGNYIYGAGHSSGLFSISVDGSGNLSPVDSDDQGDHALNVWGDGNYIYLANRDGGILSYSVNSSGVLTHVDSHDPGGYANGIWGDGKYIYLAAGDTGLHWYTVDGSGNLTHVDSDDQGSDAKMVWGDSNNIYLANFNTGLEVYKDGLIHNSTNAGTFEFNGSNDYVNTGDTFQSTFRSSFSIEFWVKADDGQPSEERQFGGEVTSGDEVQLALQHSSNTGKLYFGYTSDGDGAYGRTSSAVLSNGATDWFHVVFIANETTDQMSIYFDGVAQSLTSGDISGVTMGDFTTSNNFYIGALNNVGSLIYEWDGNIAITRIYNKALSSAEVLLNYNAQRGRFGV